MSGAGQPLPNAELHFGQVERGGSFPQKFFLSGDLKLCAVKFQQNPQGPRMLANEWLGHGLAAMLDIRHAPYGLVNVPPTVLPDGDRLIVRVKRNYNMGEDEFEFLPGIHFYSQWLEPADYLKPEDLGLAGMVADVGMLAGVAVLDTLLNQWDRSPGNPNLLMVRQARQSLIYLIDMGMAFGDAMWTLNDLQNTALPDVMAPLPYRDPPVQLFKPVRVPQDFGPYLERVAGLTAADFRRLVEALPDEWSVTVEERQALIHYLSNRAKALPAYFETRFGRSGQEWWQ